MSNSLAREIQKTAQARTATTGPDAGLLLAISDLQRQINGIQQNLLNATGNQPYTPSAASVNTIVTMTNGSGVARDNGDVVLVTSAAANTFTVPNVAGQLGQIGVVYSDSADGVAPAIAIAGTGDICLSGLCNVSVDATIAILAGDPLATGAGAFAVKAANWATEGVFAVALEPKASGTGLIDAFVIAPRFDPFRYSFVTADSASALTLADNVYEDGSAEPYAIVLDTVTGLLSLPTTLSAVFGAHARFTVTRNAGTHCQLDNSAADWDTGADSLLVIWCPEDYQNQVSVAMWYSMVYSWTTMMCLTGTWGGAGWTELDTTATNVLGAIDEMEASIGELGVAMSYLEDLNMMLMGC